MKIFARICSTIFHPVIMPLVGLFVSLYYSYLQMLGSHFITNTMLVVASLIIAIPCIGVLILYKLRVITSVGLVRREERTYPYLLFFICYLLATIYLYWINLRGIQLGFFIGGLVALAIDLLINKWWKISVHMTSIGGLTGLIFVMSFTQYIMYTELVPTLQAAALICSGAVGTSRIILRRHTLGQVCCGFLNGFFWVFLCSLIALTLQYVQ